MCLLFLMDFDFASFDWVAYTGNIYRPLALIRTPSVTVYAALASNWSVSILYTLGVHLVLVDLPYGLLQLLLLRDIVLADFTALIMLILFEFSEQILQITFILAVVRVALFALSYLRVVALQCGSTFVGDRGGDGIVSDGVIGVVDASLVLFRGGILRVLNGEYMIDIDVRIWWIYHVEVMLVTLTHRIFSCMNNSFLLAGPVASQRLLVDWRLLVLLVLRATSLSLIWRFSANDLRFKLNNVARFRGRGHSRSVVSTSMHYKVVVVGTGAAVVIE